MYNLIVDYREKDIKECLETLEQKYESKNLELGDIVITDSDDNIVIIIERKTISDYVSSISDKRSKEQRIRLLDNYRNKSKIFYLVEGFSDKSESDYIYRRGVSRNSVLSSVTHLQLRDDIIVYHTKNVKESVEWILKILVKLDTYPISNLPLKQNEGGSDTRQTYIDSLKSQHKKTNNKIQNIYTLQLLMIPRMSVKYTDEIQKLYPNFFELTKAYNLLETEKEKEELLKDITAENGRKLGKVLSKNVYTLLKN